MPIFFVRFARTATAVLIFACRFFKHSSRTSSNSCVRIGFVKYPSIPAALSLVFVLCFPKPAPALYFSALLFSYHFPQTSPLPRDPSCFIKYLSFPAATPFPRQHDFAVSLDHCLSPTHTRTHQVAR